MSGSGGFVLRAARGCVKSTQQDCRRFRVVIQNLESRVWAGLSCDYSGNVRFCRILQLIFRQGSDVAVYVLAFLYVYVSV